MRIALTHAFCWPEVRRGGERFIPGLAAALTRRGHEVIQYSAARRPQEVTGQGFETVTLRRVFTDDTRHEMDFALRLLPRLATARFDAVHSLGRHDALASIGAARIRRDGRRTVFTDLGFPDRAWWRTQGRLQARSVTEVVKHIDTYSAMSKAAVGELEKNYGRDDGVVVPGGVDLAAFGPSITRSPEPTILFSGVIDEPRKGVAVLLEALPLIAEAEPRVVLWLSGPGDPQPLLDAAPPAARRHVEPLALGDPGGQSERYGRAWVTCLPSMHDSFGMAVLESLACGTPAVTTDHGAPQELISPGVTGELCRPEDPESLAEACLRGFELAQRTDTAQACRAAAEPFDWDHGLAPMCERLYQGAR